MCPSSLHGCVVTDCAAVGIGRTGVVRRVAREIVTGSDSEHCLEGRVSAAALISFPNGSHRAVCATFLGYCRQMQRSPRFEVRMGSG